MILPKRGNRNTVLSLWMSAIPAVCWMVRGFAIGDWTGLEWVAGSTPLISATSAFRARGEYANQ